MEVIREIVSADILTPFIDLPWKSKDLQVEMIIMPLNKVTNHQNAYSKSLKGCLKEYANTALLEKESEAWENHIVEKYAIT